MDSYSVLWGTAASGEYRFMWVSRGLQDFLRNIGAKNPDRVVEHVQNTLRAFTQYPDYASQPSNDLPVSMHYSPMHLYKQQDEFKQIQPFCALSVTGSEQRAGGRDSTYTHTVILTREEMYGTVGKFNHVDQLFGKKLADARSMAALRDGRSAFKPDAEPEKVHVELTDLATAIYAASVILENEGSINIVFKLEPGCAFNVRAVELLKQIYSLLPPRLAAETGFATYHDVKEIDELSNKNSIQLYVLPAGTNTGVLDTTRNIVLELGVNDYRPPLEKTPLTQMLEKWTRLTWENRSAAYQTVFADTETNYQDSEVFLQRSEAFFANVMAYEKWLADEANHGTITALNQIERIFKEHPEWESIPWARKQLRSQLSKLLKKGITVPKLRARSLAECKFLTGDAQMAEYAVYQETEPYGAVDVLELCNAVSGTQSRLDGEKAREEKLALVEQHRQEMLVKEGLILQEKKAREEERAAALKAQEDLKLTHDKALQDIRVQHDKAMQDICEQHQQVVDGMNKAHQAALTAEQDKLEKAHEMHKATLADLAFAEKNVAELESCIEEATQKMEEIVAERDLAVQATATVQAEKNHMETEFTQQLQEERAAAARLKQQILDEREEAKNKIAVLQNEAGQQIAALNDHILQEQKKTAEAEANVRKVAREKDIIYDELRRAQEDNELLRQGIVPDHDQKKTLPWWLMALIGLLVGMILIGSIWGITALVGKLNKKDVLPEESPVIEQVQSETMTAEESVSDVTTQPEVTPAPEMGAEQGNTEVSVE